MQSEKIIFNKILKYSPLQDVDVKNVLCVHKTVFNVLTM